MPNCDATDQIEYEYLAHTPNNNASESPLRVGERVVRNHSQTPTFQSIEIYARRIFTPSDGSVPVFWDPRIIGET